MIEKWDAPSAGGHCGPRRDPAWDLDAASGLLSRVDRPPPCGLPRLDAEAPKEHKPRQQTTPTPCTVHGAGNVLPAKHGGERIGNLTAPSNSSKTETPPARRFTADATNSTHDRTPWARRRRWRQSANAAKFDFYAESLRIQLAAAIWLAKCTSHV